MQARTAAGNAGEILQDDHDIFVLMQLKRVAPAEQPCSAQSSPDPEALPAPSAAFMVSALASYTPAWLPGLLEGIQCPTMLREHVPSSRWAHHRPLNWPYLESLHLQGCMLTTLVCKDLVPRGVSRTGYDGISSSEGRGRDIWAERTPGRLSAHLQGPPGECLPADHAAAGQLPSEWQLPDKRIVRAHVSALAPLCQRYDAGHAGASESAWSINLRYLSYKGSAACMASWTCLHA